MKLQSNRVYVGNISNDNNRLAHWKYVSKKRSNGKWQYYYGQKKDSNKDGRPSKEEVQAETMAKKATSRANVAQLRYAAAKADAQLSYDSLKENRNRGSVYQKYFAKHLNNALKNTYNYRKAQKMANDAVNKYKKTSLYKKKK